MSLIVQRYVRRTVLALMLLLAASANCLSVSYDTNQDDDIPPVKVHFCFVTSGVHLTAGKRAIDSTGQTNGNSVEAAQDFPAARDVRGSISLNAGSPSLVVPLRR